MTEHGCWNRRRGLLGWLCLACMSMSPAFAGEGADGPDSAVAATASLDSGIAQDWKSLLERGDYNAIYATYALASELETEQGEVDAEQCRRHAADIEKALLVNRVGMGLWYAAHECAVATQDPSATARLERFEALLRYAFAARVRDDGATPIRVLAERDADAVVMASGQELLYAYYDRFSNPRNFNLYMGLWDAETNRERILVFDFLDSNVQLRRDLGAARFPNFRRQLVKSFVEDAAKTAPHTPAGYADAINQAIAQPTIEQRREALTQTAADGNLEAAMSLVGLCLHVPEQHCGGEAIDSLLPYAERHYAPALVLLAVAYSQASGTARDDKAARALLDAADERLGERRGRIMFAALSTLQGKTSPMWPLVRKELQKAADGENFPAAILVATADISAGKPLLDDNLKRVLAAAKAGYPAAQFLYGLAMVDHGRAEAGAAWLEHAADADFTPAQSWLGKALYTGKGMPADVDRALPWLARAGHGGDAAAMTLLGRYHSRDADSATSRELAQGWLQSAAALGNLDATLALAELYESGADGLDGDAKRAASIYRDLAEQRDSAVARRRWARLLRSGKGVERDPVKAESLLLGDAQKNDIASQMALASLLFANPLRRGEGLAWLEKASAGGDAGARGELAFALWYGQSGRADPARAIQLWQQLARENNVDASNNYAWALCTGTDSSVSDGISGIMLLQAISDGRSGWAGALDTLAACHATTGDFSAAALAQQRAAELFARMPRASARFKDRVAHRLSLYTSGQRYIEVIGGGD
ncbi:MAG: tetratricopeptide repeat protein [Tahibacter sp.]